jgi:hypothetical protein
MTPRRLLPVLCLLALSTVLAACGDGGGETTAPSPPAAPAAAAKADAICRSFLGEIEELGHGALANPPSSTLQLTTDRLVRPSLPLIKHTAARLQGLKPSAESEAYDLYADLFDPFVILTEKRLQVGLEEDYERARGLEAQLTDLSLVQRRTAQLAGIPACDRDFPHVLLQSLTE